MVKRRAFCASVAYGLLASLVGCSSKPDPRKKGFVLQVCKFVAKQKKKKLSQVNPSTTVGSLYRGNLEMVMFFAMIQAAFHVPKNRDMTGDLRPNAQRTAQLRDITMLELGQWLEKNAQDDVAWESFTKALSKKKK